MTNKIDYGLISTDDHIIEPPDVWHDRLESKLQQRAPRLEEKDGKEFWSYEGTKIKNVGLSVMAGKSYEQFSPKSARFTDMLPGCYDPKARLKDMDADGVEVEVCFPTVPGLAGTLFAQADDKDLGLACLRAYNDWLADTWCAADPKRLIGQLIVPLWDVGLAVKELERAVGLGHKALTFPNAPETLDLPGLGSDHWDPLWDAVEEAGIPVTLHVASGNMRGAAPLAPAADARPEVFIAVTPSTNFTTLATLLFSGVLEKHPKLKFVSVEAGIGWLGYMVERADETFKKHRHWTKPVIKELPSFYFRRQIYANFLDDPVGVTARHHIGIDNIMMETDYPHSDTTFPETKQLAEKRFADVPADETRKILRDNAIGLYNLDL